MALRVFLLLAWFFTVPATADFPRLHRAGIVVSPTTLEAEAAQRVLRVPEFAWLADWSARTGIPVWLFGGSAATAVHYVKWDLLREGGDTRFRPALFDYKHASMFRRHQDTDLVIDGTDADAAALEALLEENFSHGRGDRVKWEVRLLHQRRGDKLALRGDADFANQNSESQSTALLQLRRAPGPWRPIVDLRDFRPEADAAPGRFLVDAARGAITFLPGENHDDTERARAGLNPGLLLAVRFAIKVGQFDLDYDPDDVRALRQLVQLFSSGDMNDYVRKWLEKNVPKIVHHSVALERSMALVDELGLREVVRRVSDPAQLYSAGWWISRKALPWKSASAETAGRTARQLGLKVVCHRASTLEAFENVMRSPVGAVLAFTSDSANPGEAADYGAGFYVREGLRNVDRMGPPIVADIDGDAVEGRDFDIAVEEEPRGPKQRLVVFKTAWAMRVRELALTVGGAEDFLARLMHDKPDEDTLDDWMAQLRHFDVAVRALNGNQRARFQRQLLQWVRTLDGYDYFGMGVWFKSDVAAQFPAVIPALLRRYEQAGPSDGSRRSIGFMVISALQNERLAAKPTSDAWAKRLLAATAIDDSGVRAGFLRQVATLPEWRTRPWLAKWLGTLDEPGLVDLAQWPAILHAAERGEDPAAEMAKVIALPQAPSWLFDALRHRTWRQHRQFPEFFSQLADRFGTAALTPGHVIPWIGAQPALLTQPLIEAALQKLMPSWIENSVDDRRLFRVALTREPWSRLPHAAHWQEWIEALEAGQNLSTLLTAGQSDWARGYCAAQLTLVSLAEALRARWAAQGFVPPSLPVPR